MEAQHERISGYRELTQEEIDFMNLAKAHGEAIGRFIEHMEQVESIDRRWLQIAKTELQKGIMFLVRAIAKPTTF